MLLSMTGHGEAHGQSDRLHLTAETGEYLLVEDRRRTTGQPLIDHKPHRVRANVDDTDRRSVIEAALYVLSLTHVIGHWWFAILTIVLVLVLPIFGQMLAPEAFVGEEAVRARKAKPPLETLGVDTPFTDEDRAVLDEVLGV